MAVSKTQNERPAIIALIDEVDSISQDIEPLPGQIESVQAQIGDGFTEVSTVSRAVSDLNASTQDLANDVSLLSDSLTSMAGFVNRFRIGLTEDIEVEAEESGLEGSITYNTPYESDAKVCVLLSLIGDPLDTLEDVSFKITSSTNEGFSYEISSADTQEAHVIQVSFVSVNVN